MLALALLVACGDARVPVQGEAATDTAGGDTAAAGDTAPPPDWWETAPDDADGDGVTEQDGDCDDLSAAVHPGAQDATCDGVDDDCDGFPDQDAAADDPWEMSSDDEAAPLGIAGTEGEALVLARSFPEGDVDRYAFYVEDGDTSWFDIEAWLVDVPPDVDLALELVWTADVDGVDRGVVASADELGTGGAELAEYSGSAWEDDSGWYEIVVTAREGARCDLPYRLDVLVGTW
jgi:hypothetical protein